LKLTDEVTETAILAMSRGVTPIANNDVDDQLRHYRKEAQALKIKSEQAHTIGATQDPEFIRRRHNEVVADLDAAQLLISELLERLEAYEATAAPPAVRHAMRNLTGQIHPIDVEIDGQALTVGIPGIGIDDPAEVDRRWRQLRQRYSRGRS
jgi:hypothetical protein